MMTLSEYNSLAIGDCVWVDKSGYVYVVTGTKSVATMREELKTDRSLLRDLGLLDTFKSLVEEGRNSVRFCQLVHGNPAGATRYLKPESISQKAPRKKAYTVTPVVYFNGQYHHEASPVRTTSLRKLRQVVDCYTHHDGWGVYLRMPLEAALAFGAHKDGIGQWMIYSPELTAYVDIEN